MSSLVRQIGKVSRGAKIRANQLGSDVISDFTSVTPAAADLVAVADASNSNLNSYARADEVAALAPSTPGYATNFYYGDAHNAYNATGNAVVADRLYCTPIFIGAKTTFTRIGIDVTTGAAGAARLGIYNNSADNPGALVLDAGTVDTTSTAVVEATISQELQPGWYWMASVFNATPGVRGGATSGSVGVFLGFGFSGVPGTAGEATYRAFTYAVLPDPFSTVTRAASTTAPLMWLRVV